MVPRRFTVAIVAAVACCFAAAPTAQAADDVLSIGHVQPGDDSTMQVLVSVPEGSSVEPDDVKVSIDGTPLDSEAELAGAATLKVRRTTVIAFDTSESMGAAGRINAAKAAAKTFIDTVPADVYVGIVTFDADVETALAPTQNRDDARAVIDGLTLAKRTRLNDGVIEAIKQAGSEGQRRILVLSDGRDTSATPESDVTNAIREAEVNVDVVALDQSGSSQAPLKAMSDAGKGTVIPADIDALTETFTAEAAALARQILVTAELPSKVGNEATVTVTAPIDGAPTSATAYAVIRDPSAASGPTWNAPAEPAFEVTQPMMFGGLTAFGLGMMVLFVALFVSPRRGPASAEARISAYGAGGASRLGSLQSPIRGRTDPRPSRRKPPPGCFGETEASSRRS